MRADVVDPDHQVALVGEVASGTLYQLFVEPEPDPVGTYEWIGEIPDSGTFQLHGQTYEIVRLEWEHRGPNLPSVDLYVRDVELFDVYIDESMWRLAISRPLEQLLSANGYVVLSSKSNAFERLERATLLVTTEASQPGRAARLMSRDTIILDLVEGVAKVDGFNRNAPLSIPLSPAIDDARSQQSPFGGVLVVQSGGFPRDLSGKPVQMRRRVPYLDSVYELITLLLGSTKVVLPEPPKLILSGSAFYHDDLLKRIAKDIRDIHGLTPRQFEELVAEMLDRDGFVDIVVTKQTRDGGVDTIAARQER